MTAELHSLPAPVESIERRRLAFTQEESANLDHKIAWLRTFKKSNEAIARELGITLHVIEQRDRRRP